MGWKWPLLPRVPAPTQAAPIDLRPIIATALHAKPALPAGTFVESPDRIGEDDAPSAIRVRHHE